MCKAFSRLNALFPKTLEAVHAGLWRSGSAPALQRPFSLATLGKSVNGKTEKGDKRAGGREFKKGKPSCNSGGGSLYSPPRQTKAWFPPGKSRQVHYGGCTPYNPRIYARFARAKMM